MEEELDKDELHRELYVQRLGDDDLHNYLAKRFAGAKFRVACFKSVDEVETKTLTDEDAILYCDYYTVEELQLVKGKQKRVLTAEYVDYFLVRKREGQTHIRHCDVIDTLIEFGFNRSDAICDHRYMENIRKDNTKRRNPNALNVYGSFWGS